MFCYYYVCRFVLFFDLFFMVFRRPGRYLKTFPRLVAPSWLNISPWRATAAPLMPTIIYVFSSPKSGWLENGPSKMDL